MTTSCGCVVVVNIACVISVPSDMSCAVVISFCCSAGNLSFASGCPLLDNVFVVLLSPTIYAEKVVAVDAGFSLTPC